ncbi:uncharacterized protein FFNC_15521 [Fusarium fujikuroi]|nr:uncharacterized protein FFNC_15521 [Fusarium fujikuroi]
MKKEYSLTARNHWFLEPEEEVNSFTCNSMSSPLLEGQNEQAEPTHDDPSPKIGSFAHLADLNLVVYLDCKKAVLASQVKTYLVDPLTIIVCVDSLLKYS